MPIVLSDIFSPKEIPELKDINSQYFDLNTGRLRDLWHTAIVRGLIKAKSKSILQHVSMTEKVIYKQCERDAKSTVSLAKCAVGLFDARDTERKQNGLEDKGEKYANMVKINITRKQSEEFLNNEEKKKHKDSIRIIYKTDNIYNSQIDIFVDKFGKKFGSTLKYGNKNPIRPQLRRRQKRSKDRIRDAFELFLAEERMKKKISNQRIARKLDKSNVTKEKIAKSREIYSIAFSITKTSDKDKQLIIPDKNVLGISRLYNKKSKRKRKIDSAELSKSRPAIDFPKIAAKYFSRMLGGATVQRSHLDNLRKIRDHYNRAEKCRAYFKLMNDENRRLFESLSLSIDSRTPEVNNNASSVLEQIVQMINSFAVSYNPLNKMSIMSPRLFSLFPDISKPSSNRLLSPTVLSFQDDGYFSLPELFDIITKNQQYQNLMLEVIMDMSGAGQVLENLLSQMSTEIKNFEEVQYPLVEEMSKKDHSFIKALNSFNDEQSMDYDNKGYAFLNEDQIKLIYGDNHEYHGINVNITELNKMTKEEKEQRIEEDIRQLAAIGRPKWPFWNDDFQISRYRRSNIEPGQVVNGVNFETLAPYAFTNMVGQGAALEVVTLSPHAFIGEILFPEALTISTLSPRALIATILSPSALIARILSPTALRAEVLAPRALSAWVLSPEALVTEVLTPRFLEPRVLSPESLVIDVLSPGILSPHLLSSEVLGVIVLSPNILSPRIASEEKLLIEVLSPHILGGPHSHQEASHEVIEIGSHSETIWDDETGHVKHDGHHDHGN